MDASDVQEAVARARDAVSVRRVFGEPFEKHGLTIIPAARIWGGGGGGLQGPDGEAPGGNFGSGFGLMGRPAGAFVVRGDTVRWQPAVDPNLIVAAVLFFFLLTLRAVRRRRRRARWARRQEKWERRHGGAVMVAPAGEGRPVPPPPPGPAGPPPEAA